MTDQLASNHWESDALGRRGLATFLSASLTEEARVAAEARGSGLTVALDADWGAGKSFFVRRWADDLRELGHPVIYFDAWENDIGDEASVALMASIRSVLAEWTERLPRSKSIRAKAATAADGAIRGLRRAMVPATKVVATGLVKKFTGIAVNELLAAGEVLGDVPNNSAKATAASIEKGLDELFKRSLDEHQRRGAAIATFKKCIGETVALLTEKASAKTPIFVFIDEVDRCRPPYAIKLLEEVKHIFGMPNLCFVVSTNIPQLQEAVRAVYGSGFDGHRYLKRFFDRQYALPVPDNENFSAQLLTDPSPLTSRRVDTGLPASDKATIKRAVGILATALGLDLRSQKQVLSIAAAAAAAVPTKNSIFILWLYFLSAVQHKKPQLIDRLQRGVDHKGFAEVCEGVLRIDSPIEYLQGRDAYGHPEKKHTKLSEVLWRYYKWSTEDLLKLREASSSTNAYDYPASNLHRLLEEAPTTFSPITKYPPSISTYINLVRYAGMSEDRDDATEST